MRTRSALSLANLSLAIGRRPSSFSFSSMPLLGSEPTPRPPPFGVFLPKRCMTSSMSALAATALASFSAVALSFFPSASAILLTLPFRSLSSAAVPAAARNHNPTVNAARPTPSNRPFTIMPFSSWESTKTVTDLPSPLGPSGPIRVRCSCCMICPAQLQRPHDLLTLRAVIGDNVLPLVRVGAGDHRHDRFGGAEVKHFMGDAGLDVDEIAGLV